jgi:hypothetical protein
MKREIARMVDLHPDSESLKGVESWCTVDYERWYQCHPDQAPMEPFNVPEDDPGMTYAELQAMAEREGSTLVDSNGWAIEERGYELLATFANLYLKGYPELLARQKDVERLVLDRLRKQGVQGLDIKEAERLLREQGMPD